MIGKRVITTDGKSGYIDADAEEPDGIVYRVQFDTWAEGWFQITDLRAAD